LKIIKKVTRQVPQIDCYNDVNYYQSLQPQADVKLQMSLLIPRTEALKPAVLYFPGGGFTAANYQKYLQQRLALAQAGYVVAAAEYRVVPTPFPNIVYDAKHAIAFLTRHAKEFGIDPQRIGVLGDSAGGYLAQFLATTCGSKTFLPADVKPEETQVAAACSVYGFCDLLTIGQGLNQAFHQSTTATEALLVNGVSYLVDHAAAIGADPEKAKAASPITYVSSDTPPFLVMHGTNDHDVSSYQAEELVTALKKQGISVTQIMVENAGHGTWEWYQPEIITQIVNWFQQTLPSF
jgi:acetyl esterase/lipase